jgi:hypothetical protein
MKQLVLALGKIQAELKAPKDLYNKFGDYRYRSAESILEAVKPLLAENGLVLTISDCIEAIGGRIYVRAVATIGDGVDVINVSAFAREAESRKGMDDSQVTGSTSSYARKYALNGLFLIDDTKDADATNDHGKGQPAAAAKPGPSLEQVLAAIQAAPDLESLTAVGAKLKDTEHAKNPAVREAYEARKSDLF